MEEFERLCDLARACAVGGRHAEAEQAFRSALQARPGDARLSVELALVLRRLRRPAEAESHLRAALAQAPGIASTHAELGAILFEQGRCPEAATAYREAIRLRPDFAKAHLALGLALERWGDFSGAEAALREASRLKPARCSRRAAIRQRPRRSRPRWRTGPTPPARPWVSVWRSSARAARPSP